MTKLKIVAVPSTADVISANDKVDGLIQKIVKKGDLSEIINGLISESSDLESSKNVARKIEDKFLEIGDKNLITILEMVILTHDKNKSSAKDILRPLLKGLTSIVHGILDQANPTYLDNFYAGLKNDGQVKSLVNGSKISNASYMEFCLSKAIEMQNEGKGIQPYEAMALTFLKNGFERETELQGGYTALELVESFLSSMTELNTYLLSNEQKEEGTV